jgi:hypothetical protein
MSNLELLKGPLNMKRTFKPMVSLALLLLLMVTTGNKISLIAQSSEPDFTVDFTDCVESIGVTLVSTSIARMYVPNQFILVGEGGPVTPLVVRTARCNEIAPEGYKPKAAEIVQIGAVIVPPDFTGDINNYTIWYSTSSEKLATQLRKIGVDAQLVPTLDYLFDPMSSSLSVNVPTPGEPRLTLSGTVQPSTNPAGSFTANWWQATSCVVVKMSTNVPVISIGEANLFLTADKTGPLGQLIGGGSIGFPVIQQFNTFPNARMQVDSTQ